jgi:hypothetical protein
MMTEPKLEVPAELRELAEKTIDQAERAFDLFFDAARRSSTNGPTPVAELLKQLLAFWEESLKTSFEYARKLALTTSLYDRCERWRHLTHGHWFDHRRRDHQCNAARTLRGRSASALQKLSAGSGQPRRAAEFVSGLNCHHHDGPAGTECSIRNGLLPTSGSWRFIRFSGE